MVRVFFSRGGSIVGSGDGHRRMIGQGLTVVIVFYWWVMVFIVCHLASLNWLHCNHDDACGNVV
jgi:hypothetical protein